VFGILGLQVLLVTFTGSAFHVYSNYGLTIKQWLICVVIGAVSMPINLLLKCKTLEEPTENKEMKEKEMSSGVDAVEPTSDELGTDSHIVKVREFAHSPSKFTQYSRNSKQERK
jgi:hypothetical protein